MDYEKKYKEALERAKRLHSEPTGGTERIVCEQIFPELVETEDEKIRKALIELVKCNERGGYKLLNNVHTSSMLAWLEKQGQVKESPISQHENKTCKENDGSLTDDVEPKFHEGEWVVDNDNNFWKVAGIMNGFYILEYGDEGGIRPSIESADKTFHLWTIQDAKDGDVLVCVGDERPFIFKGLLDPNHPNCPVAYCGIDDENLFLCSTGKYWWTDYDVKPATKEQRDALMKAMADEGWEFDFEKKELKEIEKKLTWSEEDEENMNNALYVLNQLKDTSSYEEDDIAEKIIVWLKSLKQRIGG